MRSCSCQVQNQTFLCDFVNQQPVGELLCESELLKVKFGFSFDEDVPTDSEEVRVCGSIGDEELPSEHARNIAKRDKTKRAILIDI